MTLDEQDGAFDPLAACEGVEREQKALFEHAAELRSRTLADFEAPAC